MKIIINDQRIIDGEVVYDILISINTYLEFFLDILGMRRMDCVKWMLWSIYWIK